jgi:hypothetical protein
MPQTRELQNNQQQPSMSRPVVVRVNFAPGENKKNKQNNLQFGENGRRKDTLIEQCSICTSAIL